MKKKEEAKEKEGGKGGENSVKQGREKLEPRWKGRKNGEVREEKTGNWKKRRLIWAYFFAIYLNYLKNRFLFWRVWVSTCSTRNIGVSPFPMEILCLHI